MLDFLGEGGTCPECQGGFVEESANAMALAEAVHWIVSDEHTVNSTEARISNLLEDLREHLATVEGSMEGLRGGMAFTMEIPMTPKLEPAPQEVRDAIMEVPMDSVLMQEMRQAPQCVVCCSDFEVGELLNRLPGCGWSERRIVRSVAATSVRQWDSAGLRKALRLLCSWTRTVHSTQTLRHRYRQRVREVAWVPSVSTG